MHLIGKIYIYIIMSDANIYSFYVTVSFDTFAFSYYLDNFDSFNVQYDK